MKYLAKAIVFLSILIVGLFITLVSNFYFIFIKNLLWRFKIPTSIEIKQWNEYEYGDYMGDLRKTYYKCFLFYLLEYKPYYKSYK